MILTLLLVPALAALAGFILRNGRVARLGIGAFSMALGLLTIGVGVLFAMTPFFSQGTAVPDRGLGFLGAGLIVAGLGLVVCGAGVLARIKAARVPALLFFTGLGIFDIAVRRWPHGDPSVWLVGVLNLTLPLAFAFALSRPLVVEEFERPYAGLRNDTTR